MKNRVWLPKIKIDSENQFFIEQIKRIIYNSNVAIDVFSPLTFEKELPGDFIHSIVIADHYPIVHNTPDKFIYILNNVDNAKYKENKEDIHNDNVIVYLRNTLKESELTNSIAKLALELLSTSKCDDVFADICSQLTNATREIEELKGALSLSRKAQKSIMNLDSLSDKFSSYLTYVPYKEVSGDVFFVKQIYDKVFIMLADVTDHGVLAGMYGATLYALANNYIQSSSIMEQDIDMWAQYMQKAAKMFYPEQLPYSDPLKSLFSANVIFMEIDTSKMMASFMFYGTGQEPPIMISSSGKVQAIKIGDEANAVGAPLGDSSVTKIYKKRFLPGDAIVLYTDGATEIFLDPENETKDAAKMYSSENITKAIANKVKDDKFTPKVIVDSILRNAAAYSISSDLDKSDELPNVTDDLTIACIKWEGNTYD